MEKTNKNQVRKEIKDLMNQFCTNRDYRELSEKSVYHHVITSEAYQRSSAVFGYMALPDELDPISILNDALRMGKKVALPRVNGDTMDFYWVDSLDQKQLEKGSFSIQEPKEGAAPVDVSGLAEQVLVLVPGRAFSMDGKRLGRGKGFYDKWFRGLEDAGVKTRVNKWGVCYPCQIVADLPTQVHDIIMDKVVF